MDAPGPSLPIGRTGRLEALGLAAPDGDHAVLVRDAGRPRALLIGRPGEAGGEGIVVTPLDGDVDVRVDGDALAVWLASGPLHAEAASTVPSWASAIGLVLLLAIIGLAVLGSLTFFGWLLGSVAR
jgi:hypothetical protein